MFLSDRTSMGSFSLRELPRQLFASITICALLLPILSIPVGGSPLRRTVSGHSEFEPVNEPLSFSGKIVRDINARFEEAITPFRSENRLAKSTNNVEIAPDNKTKSKSIDKALNDVDSADSENTGTRPVGEDRTTGSIAPASEVEATSRAVGSAAPYVFNQLPDDELESVYSYENNLGSPPGQTEADSSNIAAAIPVRHRVGAANFSFGVPLAGLSGRGLDAGLGMTYNSRTWNKSCAQYNAQGQCIEWRYKYDVDESWIAPGFSSGFGYIESAAQIRNVVVDAPNNNWMTEITPFGITDPNGTRHQFTCKATTPIPGTNQNRCSLYGTSDGTRIEVAGKLYVSNPGNQPTPNTSNYSSATWVTTLPGGTRVWYTGGFGSGDRRKHYPFVIQDRNGNRIRIEYHNDGSGRITKITDTLNRQIKFYYETGSNPDRLIAVSIPGMNPNEEIQTVRFYYEDIALNAAGKFQGTIEAPTSIRALRWVYMPGSKTAYKYNFHPNYGMITRIERRVGVTVSDPNSTSVTGTVTGEGALAASTEYDYPDGSTVLTDAPRYSKRTDDWAGRTATTPAETFYDIPDQIGGGNTSRITLKDNGFDVETKTITDATGMVKETTVTKRFGPSQQYSELMSKSEFTWSSERNLTKLETTNQAGQKRKTEFEYDQYNNQTEIREYDFNPGSGDPTLLRTTQIEYQTGSGWINKNLTGLPIAIKTLVDGSVVSKTLLEYDHNGNASTITPRDDIDAATHSVTYNPAHLERYEEVCPSVDPENLVPPGGCVIIHHPGYDASSAYRGNVTKVTRFSDATLTSDSNADVKNYNYDIAGNLVSATLSCCSLRTWDYIKEHEYAYPVSQKSGNSPQLETITVYNRNTGLVLTTRNENLQVTTYEYETDTLRPRRTTSPNGGY
ncbi:MAG TPA: hypothetical protein PKE66_03625, partial [Pyrinomonadaceae bacterium]|nr:hypothetical protein [Pyrinomonadaceae bacterium]